MKVILALLEAKALSLFDGAGHLGSQLLQRLVGWQVKTIEAKRR